MRGKMQLGFGHNRAALLSAYLAVILTGSAAPSLGAELSYETRVSERFEYDNNIFLVENSLGEVFGSLTSVAADIAWTGPEKYWKFHSDADFRKYFGAGSEDSLDALNHHHVLNFHKDGIARTYNLSAAFAMENAAESELRDTGFTRQNTDRVTFGADGDVSAKLNEINALTLGVKIERVDFTDETPDLVPYLDFGITGSWTHQINETTAFRTELGWSLYEPDDVPGEKTHTYRLVGRLDKKLRENFTLKVKGGAAFRTDDNAGGGAFDLTSSSASGIAGIDLQYASETRSLIFSANHDLVPSASGELQQRTAVTLGATERINSRSQLGISTEYQHQEASGTTGAARDFYAVSPLYSIELARRWRGDLGYSFKLEDKAGDISTSHKTYVSLTRTFSRKTCAAACAEK